MEHIRQELIDGCGVACFAMVTGMSYCEALEVLHPFEICLSPGGIHSTNNDELLQALKVAGFDVQVYIRPDIRTLKTSILTVWYKMWGEKYLHTVVWDAEKQLVLDPYEDRPFDEYVSGICLAFELTRT